MTKKQDSGLSCFMIVMKFHGIPITREQAEQIAGDLIDISEYYENENGVEWLVMIPMF